MKRTMVALALVGILTLSGCSFIRRAAITMSKEDLKNAATARIIATNCMKTWGISSGFVRKALGVSIAKLPKEAVDAMDALDALQKKGDDYEYTDIEVGNILGYKAIICSSIVKRILKDYAPDVFNLIPAFFL